MQLVDHDLVYGVTHLWPVKLRNYAVVVLLDSKGPEFWKSHIVSFLICTGQNFD